MHDTLNKPIQDVPIESALKDASEKITFYAKEAERLQGECQKWMEVRNRLIQAQEILQGKVVVRTNGTDPAKRPTHPGVRMDWVAVTKQILTQHNTLHKRQFFELMWPQVPEGLSKQSMYQAVATMKLKNILEEVDGMFALKIHPVENGQKSA